MIQEILVRITVGAAGSVIDSPLIERLIKQALLSDLPHYPARLRVEALTNEYKDSPLTPDMIAALLKADLITADEVVPLATRLVRAADRVPLRGWHYH